MQGRVAILGVRVHHRTKDEIIHYLSHWLLNERERLHHIATVNPEFIMTARNDQRFARVLQGTDLATADGVGITIAARVLGHQIPGRITGVDLTEMLSMLENPAPKLFFLGAAPGVGAEAADRLRQQNPDLRVCGTFSGSPDEAEREEIFRRIRESQADTLLVAFGAPAQDLWIAENRQALAACGIVIAIGVGGTFDYLSGRVPRAPRLIRRIGLEWLYRLIRQPWRWRRQLALPKFAMLVLWERITGKGKASVSNHGSSED
jgi:N-acetylglucosaminyldiphosphoundecaprenol N-acetyl-beta-D-mannosaminyltransferase